MNKKMIFGILSIFILVSISVTCYATEENETTKKLIDFTEAKYEVVTETNDNNMLNKIKITGIKDFENEKNRVYYTLTNDDNKTIDQSEGEQLIILEDGSAEIAISESTDLYLYLWVNRDNNIVTIEEAYKIERTIPYLTKRIGGLFLRKTNGDTYITAKIQFEGFKDITNLKCKIGLVTDIALLREIKSDATTGTKKLLEFAETDSGIKQITVNANGNTDFDLNELGLENGKYYYVYFATENSEKHFELEDINLYQATISENKSMLHRMDKSEFKWDFSEETEKEENEEEKTENKEDNTVSEKKLPNTGKTLLWGILAIIVIITIAMNYNKNRYKNV